MIPNPLSDPGRSLVARLPESKALPRDTTNPEYRTSLIDDKAAAAQAQSDISDVLSEYDDLISNSTPDAAPDTASANARDDSSDGSSDVESIYADHHLDREPTPSMFATKPSPPHLKLEKVDSSFIPDEDPRTDIEDDSPQSAALRASPQLTKLTPKSPNQISPLASFFGWGNNPSPSLTEFSSVHSPVSPTKVGLANDTHHSTNSSVSDGRKPHATSNPIKYCESYLSTPPPSTSIASAEVEEMEEELKAISSELAASIRREMDLEDLVDRLQEQTNNAQAPGKRTSDYFSDSGYSSAKLSEYDQSREEIEKIQRRSEQEKASIRLELSNKVQDERSKRKVLDQQIKELVEKASKVDLANMNSMDASGRVKELENTCEDLRRRLSDERQSKINFEDLLSALKGELRDACDERDNLRDEIVPQLRARVEGLESEAAEYTDLTYESTKMQQQLQSLKNENNSLRNSMTGGPEDLVKRMSAGLARSNSAAAASYRGQMPPNFPLARSDSFKNVQSESRDALAERLKDVEAQRDALHSALKNLLERQEFQNREHDKKIRILEKERQRLLHDSPKKMGFQKDISKLRTEVNVLRHRAEEALEEKWQVEKGLSGLKMDLDRAEEEIESLRSLLREKDILIPPSLARSSQSSDTSGEPVTSDSLQMAYAELQKAYTESLQRINTLEFNASSGPDEKTKLAMERLERSLSAALLERDATRKEMEGHRNQFDQLAANEATNMNAERALADELIESANRVEQLASQVRQQLSTNAGLRTRLSETIARGEADRKLNSERISELQERLRSLEEQVISTQTASEERIARHEEEIAQLQAAHNEQLRRINLNSGPGLQNPRKTALLKRSPSAVFSNLVAAKSFEEEAEMNVLRMKIAELERTLTEAENEMQDVVARMNTAQIEVLNLQEERESAVRETKRLQAVLNQEQVKSFEERFRSLSSNV